MWCSPSQTLGGVRSRELFECKADFYIEYIRSGINRRKKIFEAIPEQESLSSFRYENACILESAFHRVVCQEW